MSPALALDRPHRRRLAIAACLLALLARAALAGGWRR